MKNIYIYLLLIVMGCLTLTSCDPDFVEKQSEASKECWFAAYDSAKVGRFDLVAKYLGEGIGLVGVPKTRVKINGLVDPTTHVSYMVVGDEFANFKLVVVGSVDFNNLLKYKQIAAQFNNDNKNLTDENKKVQAQLAVNEQVQNDLLKSNIEKDKEIARCHGMIGYKIEQFFLNLINWSKWIIPIGSIALIALCIWNLPLAMSIFGIIFGIIARIFNIFLEIINNFLSLFTSKTS